MTAKKTIGIVGARGHTGTELIRLVANHPGLELAFVSSRELDGLTPGTPGNQPSSVPCTMSRRLPRSRSSRMRSGSHGASPSTPSTPGASAL